MTRKARKVRTKTARTPDHQAAVLARRASGAAGAHQRRVPRGTARRSAIADQFRTTEKE